MDESAAQTISLKDWFVNLTKKFIDLGRPKSEPQRQEPTPKPQHQPQGSAKYLPITSQATRPDLAELAIGLLQRVDSSTIDFGTYQIEIDRGERTRPIIKISHQDKLSMTIEQIISNCWLSKVANADRPIDRQEEELEYLLKTANIKLDLVTDYETRVLNKIVNLDRSILTDDYVNSVLLETIDREIEKISPIDYNSRQQITFGSDSIKKLVDTVDWHHQCLELEKAQRSQQKHTNLTKIEIAVTPLLTNEERSRAMRIKTNRDVVPTAGDLRAAYISRMDNRDLKAATELEKAGIRLNKLCPEHLKIDGKAPDTYRNQEVFIERQYLKLIEQLQQTEDDEIQKDDGMSR